MVGLLCAMVGCTTPIDQRPAASLKVDPRLRAQFFTFGAAITPQAHELSLRNLRVAYNNDPSAFIIQLVMFDISNIGHGEDSNTWTMPLLLEQLPVKKEDCFWAAVPLLTVDDPTIHEHLLDLMGFAGLDRCRDYLQAHPTDNGNGVAEPLFRDDPYTALAFVMKVYAVGDAERHRLQEADTLIYIAAHSGNNPDALAAAQARMDDISRSQRWWVRLYVARQMVLSPKVVNEETAKRLAADPDFRVRLIAAQRRL